MSTKRKLPEIEKTADVPRRSKKSWKSVTAAIQYHEMGQYGKALPLLFKYEDVEARAMFLLAYMYSKGLGVIENMNTAASYLTKLVSSEGVVRKEEEDLLAMAHYYLGDLYYRGVVLARDDKKAVNHWRQGATLDKDPDTGHCHYGTIKCQTSLAMFYSNPKFKKSKKAFFWHKKAAESGSVVSKGALGVMYMYGIGTEEDMQLAYDHLTSAAVLDNVYARGYLAAYYYRRQMYHRAVSIGRELSEIEDYQTLADLDDCNVDHVKQGVAIGCFYLALCLQYGYAVEKNLDEGKRLIKKALLVSTDLTYDLHVNAILGTL